MLRGWCLLGLMEGVHPLCCLQAQHPLDADALGMPGGLLGHWVAKGLKQDITWGTTPQHHTQLTIRPHPGMNQRCALKTILNLLLLRWLSNLGAALVTYEMTAHLGC